MCDEEQHNTKPENDSHRSNLQTRKRNLFYLAQETDIPDKEILHEDDAAKNSRKSVSFAEESVIHVEKLKSESCYSKQDDSSFSKASKIALKKNKPNFLY